MKFLLLILIGLATSRASLGACVKTSWVNLKSGPGLQFETKWVVPKNTPLKVIERSGQWFLIEEMDRVRSWVDSNKLTESYFCGIVKWEKTKLSPARNAKSKLAFYDESYKILKIKNKKWVYVKNDLKQGWVYKKSLWVH